ncbi:hypothetical protein CXG81DRAFT_12437 [Caulochytrium protostelioides]|uniref:Inositol hexakisphosphate-domain-containing protein n=1 Tax=Caulochytrium protostelioides TaxID=1555241 RepID=A0A4P9X776_9FUNG|nr:hypothetical protein CXG81DRAFT_12437 [Caulochytrium protostelioides]|eukprot:RKP01076.1 hypothetical protein CXG81DRAFT_12437 [Caulochytrium protostelioides]
MAPQETASHGRVAESAAPASASTGSATATAATTPFRHLRRLSSQHQAHHGRHHSSAAPTPTHHHHHHHHHAHHLVKEASHALGGSSSGSSGGGDGVATATGASPHPIYDFTLQLCRSASHFVQTRAGVVLGRNTILKADTFASALNTHLDFYAQGAGNFRIMDHNVIGVAQPTVTGIKTILTLLSAHQGRIVYWLSGREEPVIYINQKPFVLRDAERPLARLTTFSGINAERLEGLERRLKDDILREAQRHHALLLVHEETPDGRLLPTWVCPDAVQTTSEVFAELLQRGFQVQYFRIPISPEQSPEDRYLDEFIRRIRSTHSSDALVFNCGSMGRGRTTFTMTVALILKRAQMLREGRLDPYPTLDAFPGSSLAHGGAPARQILWLVGLLERHGLSGSDWILQRASRLDDLQTAFRGDYAEIRTLVSLSDQGPHLKRMVDKIIDHCDIFSQLRDMILIHRIRYSMTGAESALEAARHALERYFFLILIAQYVHENVETDFARSVSQWIAGRPEVVGMLRRLRSRTDKLRLFRPVHDLSPSQGDAELAAAMLFGSGRAIRPSAFETKAIPRGELPNGHAKYAIEHEMERHVISHRQGLVLAPHTVLKEDLWKSPDLPERERLNFRQIAGRRFFAVAQPPVAALEHLLTEIPGKVVWINLREEPLIYIGGLPFVLRDEHATLRNIKSYAGVTSLRLERMESHLKTDCLTEAARFDNRILVHDETSDGKILAYWRACGQAAGQNGQARGGGGGSGGGDADVLTLLEVMTSGLVPSLSSQLIRFARLPITAEHPPDESDCDALLEMMTSYGPDTHFIVNCQRGMGRSTMCAVLMVLIEDWQRGIPLAATAAPKPMHHYRVVHALLRVIRQGLEIKNTVDAAIDLCGEPVNLRDSIDTWRQRAEGEQDPDRKREAAHHGRMLLRRYFWLIMFRAYLNDYRHGEGLPGFRAWRLRHRELDTILSDLLPSHLDPLVPVAELVAGDGLALSSEVIDVMNSRSGAVLGPQMILKYDLFPGAQKMTLREKIEGAPNFREIPLGTRAASHASSSAVMAKCHRLFGIGMPTRDAMRTVVSKMDRPLRWTSLREEPVLYVNGKPYVLRMFHDPMCNLEATGINAERVEQMETQMKHDALQELQRYHGRLLLHDEQGMDVVPIWETASPEAIQTPRDVYDELRADGYRVEYTRLPITDEQAPIPDVFDAFLRAFLEQAPDMNTMFNCQMGRGRTTTGLVVTCLMERIIGRKPPDGPTPTSMSSLGLGSASVASSPTDGRMGLHGAFLPASSDAEHDGRARYLRGEYRLILSLIALLSSGQVAKALTDEALDRCEAIQNLRSAIYDYRLRVAAMDPAADPRAYERVMRVGINYLIRYFYLICFCNYLLDIWGLPEERGPGSSGLALDTTTVSASTSSPASPASPAPRPTDIASLPETYSAWLRARREIINLVHQQPQSLD